MSLLGFLGNVATGFLTGGPAGAVAGGIVGSGILKSGATAAPKSSALTNIATAVRQVALPPAQRMSAPTPQFFPQSVQTIPTLPGAGQVSIDSTRTSGVSLFPGGPMVGTQTTYSSPKPAAGGACPVGYHLNRTGYWTKHGYVAKHSTCVKNRRRNPLNPRALSRSMSRIHSAKKAAHFLDRIHIGACRPKRARQR